MGRLTCSVANDKLTAIRQFSCLPTCPQYCRTTPTECLPFLHSLSREAAFAEVAVSKAKHDVGLRKIRVELNGALNQGYGARVVTLDRDDLPSQAEGFQGLQRRRGV